jgi:hypothetical protein
MRRARAKNGGRSGRVWMKKSGTRAAYDASKAGAWPVRRAAAACFEISRLPADVVK